MSLWQFIVHQFQTNQFVTAALIAAPATALTYSARALPSKLYEFVKKLVTLDIRFNSDTADYEAVQRFITKTIVRDYFSRNYTYQTESKFNWDTYDDETKHFGLTAGYGIHFGIYKKRIVIVDRWLDDAATTEKFKEHTRITFLTRNKDIIRQFADDVAIAAGTKNDEVTSVQININDGRHWDRAGKLPLRRMDTIFTADNAGNRILSSIRDFEAKKDEHHRKGLPHHLGILLYGEPGCGKSSLIHALASETGRSIYYLNLGSVENDKELTNLVTSSRDWSKALLVLEDFDASGVNVEARTPQVIECDEGEAEVIAPKKKERTPVTLSTMLNILDGLIAPDGLVTIATTNHPEMIDPALRRPGRFDQSFELGKLGWEDYVRMCNLFEVEPESHLRGQMPMTGAKMRSYILEPMQLAA